MPGLVVTIDGPAGVGKSTVGKAVALKYDIGFLSTGEMYRCFAYQVLKAGINPDDEQKVLEAAKKIKWSFEKCPDGSLKVLVDGQCFGDKLLSDEVGQMASKVSANAPARAVITQIQKDLGKKGGIVMEGRDIGTVICPDAKIKIYLDASAEERAKRRLAQLKAKGQKADYNALLSSIIERDNRDKNRPVAPLVPAADAIIIDTSDLSLTQVIDEVMKSVETKAS